MSELEEYEKLIDITKAYPSEVQGITRLAYTSALLAEEAGEVNGKFAKMIRDGSPTGVVDPHYYARAREEVLDEMGDTLWALVACAKEWGYSFRDILNANNKKLLRRLSQNRIHGSGDTR